ncbi:substrate-binding domain-containing protein [Evansella cellulosilytica]|uniref:Periplasmic binding protein/LacI transcriptional regulator n=1 Tax=Evansella cellulosilytica (strain ATCC 21833 / DSM 2522 / FERM P-1141 / JCM 9156 / N-4) TaxID=649639 RepID=E6TW76_EVAC2|nr:substrate-binding domain-containing protein [Evansella cellulosilytica]ADU31032.1 periplasmic binding protein/LacI transcriptional regulator [Evansella cellulosilytica DSM 2522]
MKKVLFLLVASILLIVGCSEDTSGDGETVLGLAMPSATHGWMGALIQNAEDQAKALVEDGTIDDYIFTTADNPSAQVNNVEDLIAQGVDAIVMLPIESDALSPIALQVEEAGIPLVIVDRELTNDAATVVVKGDNYGAGVNAGEYFMEQLGGNGKVVEIAGPSNSVTQQRSDGFREAIEGSDIEIVASQSGEFSTETSLQVMENILTSQPEIDAVYTQDDGMALGVLQAINEANRTDIQFITGVAGSKDVYEIIMDDGLITATFLYSPLMVKEGVIIGADLANGEDPDSAEVVVPATPVTKDNVDDHYDPEAAF